MRNASMLSPAETATAPDATDSQATTSAFFRGDPLSLRTTLGSASLMARGAPARLFRGRPSPESQADVDRLTGSRCPKPTSLLKLECKRDVKRRVSLPQAPVESLS